MATVNAPFPPDDRLKASYLQAEYVVFTDGGNLPFHIGQASDPLNRVLRHNEVHSACFMTAANPGSVLQPDQVNSDAHRELIMEIEQMGYRWMPGVARDPKRAWPDEVSILIPGVRREEALATADRFGQIAIVWIDQRGLPSLLWVAPEVGPRELEAG